MKAKPLAIPDVILLEPQVFEDDRGFFFESFNQAKFEAVIGRQATFVQDKHSRSVNNVLRGLQPNSAIAGQTGARGARESIRCGGRSP